MRGRIVDLSHWLASPNSHIPIGCKGCKWNQIESFRVCTLQRCIQGTECTSGKPTRPVFYQFKRGIKGVDQRTCASHRRRLLDHFIQRAHTKYQLVSLLQPVMMSSHHSHGGCPLALVILLLVSMDPTATEVVTEVSNCTEFFLDGTPPEIPGVLQHGTIQDQNRYKPICQTFYNTKRFMTLYDTDKKIPVFSAYRYTGHTVDRPSAIWKGEPQLETPTSTEVNMRKMKKPTHQASLKDYRGETYNKGHLFPSSHASDDIVQKSTFTMTNAVPQDKTFNSRSWGIMEENVKDRMDELCYNQNDQSEAFVVTGAIPSANTPPLNNKVNIPTILWTAFCCYNKVSGKWLAYAHWGDNNANTPRLQTKTLAELNTAHKVEPFPNDNCRGASQS